MKNFRLYIGADNETGKIDRHKIRDILKRYHNGFTIHATADGFWKGEKIWYQEKSVMVEITDKNIKDTIKALKKELNQEAIGFVEESPIAIV